MPFHRFLIVAALLQPGALLAQTSPAPGHEGWFPSTFVVQPVAGARSGVDIGTGPLFVRRDRPAGSGDPSPEADVSLGYRVPVYRFSDGGPGGPAFDLGIETGMLARFALGEGRNGLINSDFRIAFPFGADFGDWEAELSLVHVSSHVGDDYIEQTPGFDPQTSSRNGVEADVMYRVDPRLRLIAGADYNWTAIGVERMGGRLGATLDPPVTEGRLLRPIGTLEVQASDFNTGLGVTGMAGVGVRAGASDLRLGLTWHAGPSEMGQFRGFDEAYLGVILVLVPSVVVHSGRGEG